MFNKPTFGPVREKTPIVGLEILTYTTLLEIFLQETTIKIIVRFFKCPIHIRQSS